MALRRKKHDTHLNRKLPIEHTGFFAYLRLYLEGGAVLNFSQETLYRHESHVRRFVVWCEERGINTPQEVTKPVLERFQKHLYYYRKANGEPLSFHSQQVMLVSLKSFFRWLTQQNHLLYNPASELQLPKPAKQLPRTILSVETVAQLLAQPDRNTPEGLRDRAILELFYSTGLRRMELANLKLYDVDRVRAVVAVRGGKGNKDRMVPLGERAAWWVGCYVDRVRDLLTSPKDEDRLFITDYGEPFNGGGLGRMVKRYLREVGIEATGSCHLLRHAMATHMLENGADVRFIQALLGHEDLNTTEIYTRVSVEKLREVHRATHPAKLEREE